MTPGNDNVRLVPGTCFTSNAHEETCRLVCAELNVRSTTLFNHDNRVVTALFNQQCCNNLCYF